MYTYATLLTIFLYVLAIDFPIPLSTDTKSNILLAKFASLLFLTSFLVYGRGADVTRLTASNFISRKQTII